MTESAEPLYDLDPGSELPPRLLELFLRAAPEQMREVVEACQARDEESARSLAHKLKGGLYAVGATRLADGLEVLRTILGKADWAAGDRQLTELRAEFERLLRELRRQLEQARG